VPVGLEAPFSRRAVTLNSFNTAVNAVVNLNLLGDPRDRDVALLAFKRARKIIIGDKAFPGKNVRSDSDIMAVIEKNANTIYHASCTCRMGTVNDTMAVVDSKATVIGVKALRVVDASAFAILPPGHHTAVVCK
jgi:choline dehydrogenase